MDSTRILRFLSDIAAHNDRSWFMEHKAEYDVCRRDFLAMSEQLILRLAEMDPSVAHIRLKDATYRFYRDTRFSPDKSPYKTHLGVYVAPHGKKGMHGGYYLHLEPGHCMLSCGCYWLPTNVLTACRNEIMGNIDEWIGIVESADFVRLFGKAAPADTETDPKGFGIAHLKTCPAGFPRDYEHVEYLRMKDYCCWTHVDDGFFLQPDWMDKALDVFRIGKPMVEFINAVVDDYE